MSGTVHSGAAPLFDISRVTVTSIMPAELIAFLQVVGNVMFQLMDRA